MFRVDDVEVFLHDTTPTTGMRHSGTYPTFVEVHHVPTGTRVIVGSENTQMKNKEAAFRGLWAVLDESA